MLYFLENNKLAKFYAFIWVISCIPYYIETIKSSKILFSQELLYHRHRVIILNRGSMFAFQWREFSPTLSSAHRLLHSYHRQKRDRRRYNNPGEFPHQPPATRAISQWARSLEWLHTVTLHFLVGKICISFFLFYCEGMLSLVVLWLCDHRTCKPDFLWSWLSLNSYLK